jgi:predicted nucleotidyltransferase component of viral defense system
MPFSNLYRQQATLLIRVLPYVAQEQCFALKGGTAINLFIRNMPRLSVDIDLTYLPIEERAASLAAIDAALQRTAERLRAQIAGVQIAAQGTDKLVTKLLVRAGGVQIKVEVAPVVRGCVFAPVLRPVAPLVEDTFGFAEMQIVSFADLYAGKAIAALDRQHPRDLFDIRDLLANEGINNDLRLAFIIYLLSHDRPMYEVLAPHYKDITAEFNSGFDGMTDQPVTIEELVAVREALIKEIVGHMPEKHRKFLISFETGEPEWALLAVPNAAQLPAVTWRQLNLARTTPEKRSALVENLKNVLFQ